MAFNFKKNVAVGVSVTPDMGLEVAQIDFASRTIQKYGCKQLGYDNNRKEISDLDVFKETLQDLLVELNIPKGADISISLPTVYFRINDYPATLDEQQITNVIEEELADNSMFKETEPCISAVKLPNSTMQFNKIAYTAMQKVPLIEIAMQVKDLGYNLVNMDSSVNSTFNALRYGDRVNVDADTSWVLMVIENTVCRVIPMQGKNYIDYFEEKISIGEVLGDAENYATVANAANLLLKKQPSQYLYIVSKTDVISAEALSSKLAFNGQIIHHEANSYAKEEYLYSSNAIDEKVAKAISLDVIGAAINKDFAPYSSAYFNLFNAGLGDIYTLTQPPVFRFGSLSYVLSVGNMIGLSILATIIIGALALAAYIPLNARIMQQEDSLAQLERNIDQINKFLKENENISSDLFDEGDEIRIGLVHNKAIYSYYTIVGTEIPKKLWLTSLTLGDNTTIEGQADNLESVYSFFRNIKDYVPGSAIKLQKLGLASQSQLSTLAAEERFDTDSILTSMSADFYQFRISDAPEVVKETKSTKAKAKKGKAAQNKAKSKSKSSSKTNLPDLEPID